MKKKLSCEPDYSFWSKLDNWSFKDAALLLHGMDPLKFKPLRFRAQEVPQEANLQEPYKTYLVLKSTQSRSYYQHNAPPFYILTVALEKQLPVPPKLLKRLNERHRREQKREQKTKNESATPEAQIKPLAQQPATTTNNDGLATRERRSLLKAIGVMALLLTKDPRYAAQFKLNGRTNAYQIAQAVRDKANYLKLDPDGLRSLDRKITEALALLREEGVE